MPTTDAGVREVQQSDTRPRHRLGHDTLLVAATFLLGWGLSFNLPTLLGKVAPQFVSWSDQDRYLQSARAFAQLDLRPDHHWYPLLYPLILAPFSALVPLYETALPDFACYVLAWLAFRHFARGFGISGLCAALIFIPTTIAWPRTGDSWLQPWTTTPSAALIWGALALAGDLIREADQIRLRKAIACGVVLGLIPVCRPADLVISGIVGLFVTFAMLRRGRLQTLLVVIAAAIVPVIAGLLLHLAIYGAQPSDYMRLSATYGENFAWIGWKAYVILIDPRPWYPTGQGLFTVLPWVPFALCGIVPACLMPGSRAIAWMAAACVIVSAVVTLCYLDLVPSGLWQFGNVHYFKWMLPALGLFLWVLVRDARRRPRLTLALVLVALLITSFRMEPVAAGPDAPARLVLFAHPAADFAQIYNTHSVLRDRRGTLRNGFDVHLVPAPDPAQPVYAEALRRDFQGDERWINPIDIALWPHLKTTHYTADILPGHFPLAAGLRYRPVLRFGLPCWLPPYPCPAMLDGPAR